MASHLFKLRNPRKKESKVDIYLGFLLGLHPRDYAILKDANGEVN